MRKALTVAALLFAIGLLLGYIGLSVRGIRAEAQTKPAPTQPAVPFAQPTSPDFQFGPPPTPFDLPSMLPPFETTPTPKATHKIPKFAPAPPPPCVPTVDPCRLRQVNVV